MRTRVFVAACAALLSSAVFAQTPNRPQFEAALKSGHAANVKRLQDWIALPTIAAEKRNVDKGAEYMRRLALDAGFQRADVVPTDGVPGVFATLDAGAKDCVGVYFMYDVKHYDPSEWSSPPLEARIVDRPGEGKAVVGRGAVNQKGPENAFLSALHAFKATGRKLPVNLVLVAEGEEEIGSTHFRQIVSRPEVGAALGKCVGVFIPSTSQDADGVATITLGAKGVVELQLISSGKAWGRGPVNDIHSSLMARVDSPAWHLVKALDTLVKDDGHTPAIDGWFEHVKPLTPRQKQLIGEAVRQSDEAAVKKGLGVQHWINDEDFLTSTERLASQPTVNIQGLVAGYTGPGGKTVLPGRAEAKIDLRLVPNMTKDEAVAKLKSYLDKKGFGDIEVNVSGGYDPTETEESSALIRSQKAAFTQAGIKYGTSPRSAGSWPGVTFTGAPLKLAASQFGIGRGNGAHAPNEWYLIESSKPTIAGLDESALFYIDYLYLVAGEARRAAKP